MGDMLPLLVGAGEAGAIYAEVNGRLAKAGVSITREDARALAELRGEILAGLGRVEFGGPAVVVLAEALACSPTLGQDGAFDTLAWLQGAFYAMRDELPVEVPDDEIAEALVACLAELGDASEVADMACDEVMAFSKDCPQAPEEDVLEDEAAYRIVDDEGRVYAFDPADWDYDEAALGWDGERWCDDQDD